MNAVIVIYLFIQKEVFGPHTDKPECDYTCSLILGKRN